MLHSIWINLVLLNRWLLHYCWIIDHLDYITGIGSRPREQHVRWTIRVALTCRPLSVAVWHNLAYIYVLFHAGCQLWSVRQDGKTGRTVSFGLSMHLKWLSANLASDCTTTVSMYIAHVSCFQSRLLNDLWLNSLSWLHIRNDLWVWSQCT